MDEDTIARAVTPLRMVFWGGLLCVLDLTFAQTSNGRGFQVDVLSDAVGAALVAVGAWRLRALLPDDGYVRGMTFVVVVSVLALLDALRAHVVEPLPSVVHAAIGLLGLAKLAATVVFCVCMRRLCEAAGLSDASRSWSTTLVLFVAIYVLPLGLLYGAGVVAVLTDTSFHFDLGPAGLLLLPVFVIPLVHLFVSTSRMKRAAEAAAVPA